MKRLIVRIALALLTFIIGVTMTSGWRQSHTPQVQVAHVLGVSDITRNAKSFHKKIVSVKGVIKRQSGYDYLVPVGDNVGFSETVSVQFDDLYIENPKKVWDFTMAMQNTGNYEQTKRAEVIISGTFDAYYSQGCWGPKYRLVVTDIEPLTPVSVEER